MKKVYNIATHRHSANIGGLNGQVQTVQKNL